MVSACTKIAEKNGDVRHAARKVPEIHMGEISTLVRNARELLMGEPELGEKIARLRELGEVPYYGGPSPGNGRASGLPYDASKTQLMASKLWGDVRKGRVLVVHADAIGAETPTTPTPPTTVVKNRLVERSPQMCGLFPI